VTSAVWLSRRGAATGREYEFLGKDDGVSGMALVPAAGVRPVHISLFPHRKPRTPPGRTGAKKTDGAAPADGRTAAGTGVVEPPPDDDRGETDERGELDRTRKRREQSRTPRKPLTPPIKGGGKSGGGGSRDPRLPE